MTRRNSFKASSYICLTMVIVVLLPVRTFAWGQKGHQIIARIAMARLSTSARQAVVQILEPGETLESVSGWADLRTQAPETRSWHFVAIPLTDGYYSARKDCGGSETCIIQSIEQQIAVLKDIRSEPEARAYALKFLVHLIGDLHQPFHVTTNTNPKDRAASLVKVKTLSGRATNLHEVWDTDLVEYGLKSNKSVNAYATQLLKKLPRTSTSQSTRGGFISTQGSITDWALEAHKLPWSSYYHTNGEFMVADSTRSWSLDQAYYEKNLEVAEVQMVRAGVRLAKVLNDIFNVKSAY
jgi:hypothetical protein